MYSGHPGAVSVASPLTRPLSWGLWVSWSHVREAVDTVSHCSVTKSLLTLCDPMDPARQASLPFTISQSLLEVLSIESVMPNNHLVLCRPLLLLPSIFSSIRVFSKESALCISLTKDKRNQVAGIRAWRWGLVPSMPGTEKGTLGGAPEQRWVKVLAGENQGELSSKAASQLCSRLPPRFSPGPPNTIALCQNSVPLSNFPGISSEFPTPPSFHLKSLLRLSPSSQILLSL